MPPWGRCSYSERRASGRLCTPITECDAILVFSFLVLSAVLLWLSGALLCALGCGLALLPLQVGQALDFGVQRGRP